MYNINKITVEKLTKNEELLRQLPLTAALRHRITLRHDMLLECVIKVLHILVLSFKFNLADF